MGYYLMDNPNRNTPQYGWLRSQVSGVIGVHTTESGVDFEGEDWGAENTAGFIGRRSDHGSYHTMGDADSQLDLVHPRYSAWADTTNNVHAMSVAGAMNAARWRDLSPERASAIVKNMARAASRMVKEAVASGLLTHPTPARRISAEEAISGSKAGFYGHGETNPGTRYDPGQNFDWDLFLSTYANEINGTEEEDDLMATPDQRNALIQELLDTPIDQTIGGKNTLRELLAESRSHHLDVVRVVGNIPSVVLNTEIDRGGEGLSGKTTLGGMVAWNDSHVVQTLAAVAASAANDGASVDDIANAVKAKIADGITVRVEVVNEAV